MRKVIYKYILLSTFVVLLVIPATQGYFKIFEEKPLKGAIIPAIDTILTPDSWFSGRFQSVHENFLNENFGFRNFFVRLRNQIYFSVFRKVFAKEVICGKDGYLYEIKYLKTHAGQDYLGEEKINTIYSKIKFIQDTLEKKGIKLVVLFAPGKASFYPEYIPAPYNISTKETNYLKSIECVKKMGINYFDFNQLFMNLKSQSKYPLYPQTGTHWSVYGMYLAFDKLSEYLENLLGKKLLKYDYSKVTLSDSLHDPDGDIANGINLFYDFPHYKMAYPEIKWLDTANIFKPKVMTVSDSYWMGVYFLNLPKKVYSQHEFWYYNKELFNYNPDGKTKNTYDVDLKESVEKNDVILILSTEATLKQIGWEFIDEVYYMYKNGPVSAEKFKNIRKKISEIFLIKVDILDNENWYSRVKMQAKERNISLDSCIQLNAEYMYDLRHQNDDNKKELEISQIIDNVYNNKEWYNKIVKQANELNISIDSCIKLNAEYVYNQKH